MMKIMFCVSAMTAYCPATLVINEMLKQQIELIKQFTQVHDRLYHAFSNSNVPDHKYTTLEGTKAVSLYWIIHYSAGHFQLCSIFL